MDEIENSAYNALLGSVNTENSKKENLQESGTDTRTNVQIGLTSKQDITFPNALTSMNIGSFNVSTGDNMPIWTFVFQAGAGFTLTSPRCTM